MQHHGDFACAFPNPGSPKYSSVHSTSSAFSASANPNEDWTKISDLAERRRIQNRIAQRNYRKKIKRRLEDLERRATSPSASPEQPHVELAQINRRPQKREGSMKRQKQKNGKDLVPGQQLSPEHLPVHYFPEDEEQPNLFSFRYPRTLSSSPPPSFSYSNSLSEPSTHATYPPNPSYQSSPVTYPEYPAQSCYLPPLAPTLPSMPSYDPKPAKSHGPFEEDLLTPFNHMPYVPYSAGEYGNLQGYQESNVNTPPLSHSHSFEYSRAGSPSIAFPGTPVSIPGSPGLIIK